MDTYRQEFVLSDRDENVAFCSGNNRYAVWKDDGSNERREAKMIISVSKMISDYLYNPFQPIDFTLRKSACIQKLVKAEISERLKADRVSSIDLDADFERKCEEKHGLGERASSGDIEELKQKALVIFRAFREFYESGPEDVVIPLQKDFIKSDYSIWADINLKGDTNTKSLCGTISSIYWNNKDDRHVGMVSWNTSVNIESPIEVTNERSPFLGTERTLLQKSECESHIRASILETKYDLKVTANIVHLGDGYRIYPVNDWRKCPCCSVFQFFY